MTERTYGGHTLAHLQSMYLAADWVEIKSSVVRDLIAAAEDYESVVKLANDNADRVALANQLIDQLRAELATANNEIAQYIAGVNKLRAENERLKDQSARYKKRNDEFDIALKTLSSQFGEAAYSWQRVYQNTERLLAENERLREDKERLDWLEKQTDRTVIQWPDEPANGIREAIDEARRALEVSKPG